MSNGQPAIRIDHVSRHYTMGQAVIRAVDDVSFDVPSGEFLAMLGSSGSGKSTLLNLIAGLDRPTSGAIVANGQDLSTVSSLELPNARSPRRALRVRAKDSRMVLGIGIEPARRDRPPRG